MPSIREATARDAPAVREIYAPIVTDTHISFETEVPSVDEIARRIESSTRWIVFEDGELLGYAYAAPLHPRAAYQWSTEISVYVRHDACRRGIAGQLMTTLLSDLREAGFVNAFALVALPNPSSVHLFETLGFRRVSFLPKVGFKNGEWRDVGWWHLQLCEPPVPPPSLRLAQSPEVAHETDGGE